MFTLASRMDHIEKSRGFSSGENGGHLSFLMNAGQFSCSIVNNFSSLKMRFGNLLFFIFLRRIFDLNYLFSFCFSVRSCCFLNLKGFILKSSSQILCIDVLEIFASFANLFIDRFGFLRIFFCTFYQAYLLIERGRPARFLFLIEFVSL